MKRKIDRTQDQTRLINLRHQHYVSQRALSHVIDTVRSNPIDHASRSTQYRARKNLCATPTPYGPLVTEHKLPLLPLTDASPPGELSLGISNAAAIMYWNCLHSPAYASVVLNAYERKPCTVAEPWSLILYEDEVDPSDGLSKNHSRKTAAFYWSILEYGAEELGNEQLWACPTLCRSTEVRRLEGGQARIACLFLEQIFNSAGLDVERSGFEVRFGSGRTLQLYLKPGLVLCDEPAFAELLGCKGHAGLKPCFCCQNACLAHMPAGAAPLSSASAWFKPITETDISAYMRVHAHIFKHHEFLFGTLF